MNVLLFGMSGSHYSMRMKQNILKNVKPYERNGVSVLMNIVK